MKKITLVALLSAVVLCGCVKSDDFDALGHEMEFTGQLRPALGLPIGHSQMNIANLVGTWQELSAMMTVDPTTNFLSFVYSDTFDGTFDFSDAKSVSRKSTDSTIVVQRHFSGTLKIDLFDKVDSVDLIGTYVTLNTFIKAFGHENYESLMETYQLNPYFSNIKITVMGTRGNTVLEPDPMDDSITVSELIVGRNLLLADNEDLSDCLRTNPKSIRYDLDLNVAYKLSVMEALLISNPAAFILDSIMLDSLTTSTTVDANFPLQIRSNEFKYDMDMDLPFETVDSAIASFREHISFGDSAYLALRFKNSLPLSFEMRDQLYDANNLIIKDINGNDAHIYSTTAPIAAAMLKDTVVAGSHYSISNGIPVESIFKTNISDRNLDLILRARKMKLTITVSSGSLPGGVSPQHVTIRANDLLESYMYIVTNPQSMQ